jgi:hypothetical protein
MSTDAPVSPPAPPPPSIDDLPTDPVAAKSLREALVAHPDFMKDWQTDQKKWTALGFLKWVAEGKPADKYGEPPYQPVADPEAQADSRAIAAVQQHAGFYRDHGYTEEQQIEIVGQRPITMEEKRWHETQYNNRKNDAEFMRRWTAGDTEALKIMRDHAIAMRLPLGTLADIARWEGS